MNDLIVWSAYYLVVVVLFGVGLVLVVHAERQHYRRNQIDRIKKGWE
jgi:hypothetical protein